MLVVTKYNVFTITVMIIRVPDALCAAWDDFSQVWHRAGIGPEICW